MKERTCSEYSNGLEVAVGWTFAHMFNFYFGEATLVLEGEGPGGEDLEFFVTERWLKENHVSRLGIKKEDSSAFSAHLESCESEECVAARKKNKKMAGFFKEGKFPGGEAIALVSVFESKSRDACCIISRENGFGNAIDEIKPFIEWFTGVNRELWVWPED